MTSPSPIPPHAQLWVANRQSKRSPLASLVNAPIGAGNIADVVAPAS